MVLLHRSGSLLTGNGGTTAINLADRRRELNLNVPIALKQRWAREVRLTAVTINPLLNSHAQLGQVTRGVAEEQRSPSAVVLREIGRVKVGRVGEVERIDGTDLSCSGTACPFAAGALAPVCTPVSCALTAATGTAGAWCCCDALVFCTFRSTNTAINFLFVLHLLLLLLLLLFFTLSLLSGPGLFSRPCDCFLLIFLC